MLRARLLPLYRWCALAWRRYLDDLVRLLVGELGMPADGRKGRDPWGR